MCTGRNLVIVAENGTLFYDKKAEECTRGTRKFVIFLVYFLHMVTGLTWVSGASTPRKIYLTRVWNMGTWQEWQEMWHSYPRSEIEDAVRQPLKGHWTKRGKSFAETMLHCSMPSEAILSYDV